MANTVWLNTLALLGALGLGGGAAAAAQAGGAASGPAATPAAPALTRPAAYALVWSEEFARDGLPDATKWRYDTGMNRQGWHNHELQYYSSARPENAQVRDGKLVITARKETLRAAADWGGQPYTSARLVTRGNAQWTYGYFEIRARLPCGRGTWPAIWMLGRHGEWPAGGELDIMEQVGSEPTRIFSTVHTAAGSGDKGVGAAVHVADACSTFHTYQMHWTAQEIRFGIDGQTHLTYPNLGAGSRQWPFGAPQFLILNIAIGGDLGGPVDEGIFPVRMEIDYVRVYQAAK